MTSFRQPVDGAALLDGDAPAWDRIDFDVACARCGYDLRMLTEPRCPECGLIFDWIQTLNRHGRESNFLFEHRWRQRPVRSYLTTLRRGLRPRRFWSQVSIHDDIRPGPLWFLFVSAPLLFPVMLFAVAGGAWSVFFLLEDRQRQANWPYTYNTSYSLGRFVVNLAENLVSDVSVTGTFILPAWFAMILVASLRQTLGRCRLRRVHVLRVGAYGAGPLFLTWGFLAGMTIVLSVALDDYGRFIPGYVTLLINCSILILFLGALMRSWYAGLRHYARLPHTFALAFVAAFMGILATITLQAIRAWF